MKRVSLGEICTIVSGSTPDSNDPKCWGGENKWVTPAELSDESFFIDDTTRQITEYGIQNANLKSFPKGTVLLSSRAPIGKVAITDCEMYCNQGFKNLICSDAIFNEYLYFCLKYNVHILNDLGRGATFKEISKKIVESFQIDLPSVDKQHIIVDQLKHLRCTIHTLNQTLNTLDKLIKSRFIEMFGDIANNTKCWKMVPLRSLGNFKTGGTPSSKHPEYYEGKIPWISSTALGPNYISSLSAKYNITEEAIRNSSTSLIPAGSLIVGTRINVGESSINTDAICTCQDIVSIYDIHVCINILFLKHCLDKHIPFMNSRKKGATIKGITCDLLKSIMIPLPPIELQKQYEMFVKQVDKSKFKLQELLDRLEILYKSLMQQYFGHKENE